MVKGSSSPLKRRGFVALLGASSSIAGCLESSSPEETEPSSTHSSTEEPTRESSVETLTENPTSSPTNNSTPNFDGWVNPEELKDGWTVVHISAEWEIVPADETNGWDPDTVEIGRRGYCKRYTVLEEWPKGYNIYNQGGCAEGVTMSIHDKNGKLVEQIELPKKTDVATANERQTSTETPTPQSADVDTGVLFDTTATSDDSTIVELSADQEIIVEVSHIDQGEELLFMVGDGTGFLHREPLKEDQRVRYPVESNDRHNIGYHAKRYEYPMNKEIEIDILVTLTEPQS